MIRDGAEGIGDIMFAVHVAVISIAFGAVMCNRQWRSWAIEQGYAQYDAQTGETVYADPAPPQEPPQPGEG